MKFLDISECSYIGGLRNFFTILIWNVVFGIWAAAMAMNWYTIQRSNRDLSSFYEKEKIHYAVLFGACVLTIFLNNVTVKYNQEVWCNDPDNFKIVQASYEVGQNTMFTGRWHYLFSICNLLVTAVSSFSSNRLYNVYKSKE